MNQSSQLNGLHKSQNGSVVFATPLRFLLLILLLTNGCGNNPSAIHKNPDFNCPSSKVVEPNAGSPYPIQQYPFAPTLKSVAELNGFCSRMKQLFAESNLTASEAGQFYSLLEETKDKELPDGNQLFFHNECYGMPMCNVEPFVVNTQVMLKKLTNDEYEIYFYHIGCGINYDHWEIHLKQGEITGITRVESWSESSPC